MAMFMASIDQTIVSTALSSIQNDLHSGLQWGAWTITIYSLGQVLVMPIAGKLSDHFGRKRIFIIAIILFTASSLLCGLSVNIYMLVALRGLQAIGGGAFMPSANGLIADHFGRSRDRALGMIAATFPTGALIGPILGGVIVTYWSWRFVFLVNVPIGIILLVLGVVIFPRSAPRVADSANRLDLHGVLLLGAFILSGMIGITSLGGSDATVLSPAFYLPVAASVVALVLFVRHAKLAPNPFIALDLLVGKTFGAINGLNFLFGAGAFGFGALVPIYAHERYGIPILEAGTLLTARAVGMILVTSATVFALRRIGYRIPMFAGFSIVVVGMVLLAVVPPTGVTPYLWLSIGGCVTGLGMGMTIPAANNAALMLSPSRISSIAGLRGMFRQSGGIVAVSIATTVAARTGDEGETLGTVFLVFAVILFLAIPAIFAVPRVKYRAMTL